MDAAIQRYRSGGTMVSLPKNIGQEYVEQLCSEVLTYEKQGPVFVATYRETGPDHFAHAATYNEVSRYLMNMHIGGFMSDAFFSDLRRANVEQRETSPSKMQW